MGRMVPRGQSPASPDETIGQIFQQPAGLAGADLFRPNTPAPARSLGTSPGSIARIVDGADGFGFGFGLSVTLNNAANPEQRMLTPPEFYDLATNTQK